MNEATPNQVVEVVYEPDCPREQVEQALAALARWSGRVSRHALKQRRSDRHDYPVTIVIEVVETASPQCVPVRRIFHVTARNISRAGLGFIAPAVFVPQQADRFPLIRSEATFQVGAGIKVRMPSTTTSMPPLQAVITRIRPINFGFLDVGVRFLAREE
jgi:hypothetical protein